MMKYTGDTATHCNTLQHTATHCNTLQHTATHCNTCGIEDSRAAAASQTRLRTWFSRREKSQKILFTSLSPSLYLSFSISRQVFIKIKSNTKKDKSSAVEQQNNMGWLR